MSKLSYLICPITGLSVSLKDDYDTSQLFEKKHPLASQSDKLYGLIRKKGSADLPKSYIIAGILLRLTEIGMIEGQDIEAPYLRGKIITYLEQEKRYQLVRLFWATYNTKAHLKDPRTQAISPIFKISLTSLATYKSHRPMIALLFAVANQEFTYEDVVYNASKTTDSWAKSTVTISGKKTKQDPISARNRVHKQLTAVLRTIDEAETRQLDAHPGKDVSGIYATKSAQKHISQLRPFLLDYHNCSIPIRKALATLVGDTSTLAIRYSILDQDDPLAKSFKIVSEMLVSFEADPIELGLDEEW